VMLCFEDLDVEGVLGFAEHVLTNADRLWAELEIDGKQELQRALFHEGLSFDGDEFGTAVTYLPFNHLEVLRPTGIDLASPRGIELMLTPQLQGNVLIAA